MARNPWAIVEDSPFEPADTRPEPTAQNPWAVVEDSPLEDGGDAAVAARGLDIQFGMDGMGAGTADAVRFATTRTPEQQKLARRQERYEEENPFFTRMGQRLKRGAKNLEASFYATQAASKAEDIIALADPENAPPLHPDVIALKNLPPAERQKLIERRTDDLVEHLTNLITTQAEAHKIPRAPVVEEAEGKPLGEALSAAAVDPIAFIAEVGVTSAPASAVALGTAAVGGRAGRGGLATGGGIGSYLVDYAAELSEGLQKIGIDARDPRNREAVKAALTDPDTIAELRKGASRHAAAVALFDALAFGAAGKVMAPEMGSRTARETVNLAAQTGVQGALGGAGEATGQIAKTGRIEDPSQVLMEVAGEAVTAPVEVATIAASGLRRSVRGTEWEPIEDLPADAVPAEDVSTIEGERREPTLDPQELDPLGASNGTGRRAAPEAAVAATAQAGPAPADPEARAQYYERLAEDQEQLGERGDRVFALGLRDAAAAIRRGEPDPLQGDQEAPGATATEQAAPADIQYFDSRLKRKAFRDIAQKVLAEDFVEGGGVAVVPDHRFKPGESVPESARPMVRTPSLNASWIQDVLATTGLSVREVRRAMEKALRGERLGVRQSNAVRGVLDYITGERTDPRNIEAARAELEQAREMRRYLQGQLASQEEIDQMAAGAPTPDYGAMLAETEYAPELDALQRVIFEVAEEATARGGDPEQITAFLERQAPDAEILRDLVAYNEGLKRDQAQAAAQAAPERGAPSPAPAVPGEPAAGPDAGASPAAAGLTLAPSAAGPITRAASAAPAQADLIGGVSPTQQAVHQAKIEREQAMAAAPPVEAGAGDLFTGPSPQVDVEDVTGRPGAERRRDLETRKRVSEMSPEEMQRELLTDPLTGLPNRRAYEESEKRPVQVAVDLDGLKWVNDNLGHDAGDQLLQAFARALTEQGLDAYHISGDEFVVQADDPETAGEAMEQLVARLDDAEIVAETEDGTSITKKGVHFSYGLGATRNEADQALNRAKAERETQGLRPRRGEEPPGVARTPARRQGEADQPPADQEVAPPANLPAPSVPEGMFVQLGNKRYQVESFKEASEKFREAVERAGTGASQTPSPIVVDGAGNEIARISYNGRVWPPGEWRPGLEPLYDPRKAPSPEGVSASEIDEAANEAATSPANELPEPTEAQKEVGNYKKGSVWLHGLHVRIENPRGSRRRPEWPPLKAHYGYIVETSQGKAPRGKDKDHLDVFLGPEAHVKAMPVFVIDQVDPKTGRFDEHKVLMGFPTEAAARRGYLDNYAPDWKGLGAIKQFSLEEFKQWLQSGNTTKPVALKETRDAGDVRGDQEAPAAGRADREEGQEQGRTDIQRETQARPEGRDAEPQQGEGRERVSVAEAQKVAELAKNDARSVAPATVADRIRKMVGLDLDKINAYSPEAAVSKVGKRWNYTTIDGGSGGSLLDTRSAAIEAARKHKALKLDQYENPEDYFDLTRLRAGEQLKLIEKYMAEGMTEMEAGARALAEIPDETEGEQAQQGTPAEDDTPAPVAMPEAPITDVGEKIGGARKDLARPTGERGTRERGDEPVWRRRYEVSQIAASGRPDEVGRWTIRDTRAKDIMGRPRQIGDTYATKEAAEAAVPLVAVARNHRVVPVGRGDDTKWEIWRDVTDRKRVKVVAEQFDSRDAAMTYMAKNAVEIIETKTSFGEEILPVPDRVRREGPVRRQGNVTGDDFRRTFGFRAVEFGNWENQAERQQVMNHAYDALADLADVLGVPPRAIGLNGELALAFGARGQGLTGARAHYEPSYGVINLTKMKGAGTLAHEWFHALDHYFGRQDTKAKREKERNERGDLVYPDQPTRMQFASHGFRAQGSQVRPDLREAYTRLIETMFRKAEQYVEDTRKADEFVARTRDDVAKALADIRRDLEEQKDPRYWKRNNKPASAEQLAAFDEIANRIIAGELLETDYRAIDNKSRRSLMSGRWTNDALERISAIYKAVRGRSGFGSGQVRGILDSLRGDMNRYSARLKLLADAQKGEAKTKQVPTSFAMEAKSIDQGRASEYWTTPHEMAARAFQAYVEDKVATQGGRSDFLTYGTRGLAIPTPWGWAKPFPEGAEREAINAAFDRFVETLQTQETDQGVALFERLPFADETVDQGRRRAIRALVGAALSLGGLKARSQPKEFVAAVRQAENLRAGLEWIAANSEKAENRAISRSVLRIAPEIPLKVIEVGRRYPEGFPALLRRATGLTTRKDTDVRVWLRYDGSDAEASGVNEQTYLHEAIHAALLHRYGEAMATYGARVLAGEAPARGANVHIERLAEMWKDLNARARRGEFGDEASELWLSEPLSHFDEFIAYGLSNTDFQAWLKRQPYKKGTAWQRFKVMILRLLGLDDSKTPSYYDAVLDASMSLLEAAETDAPVRHSRARGETALAQRAARAAPQRLQGLLGQKVVAVAVPKPNGSWEIYWGDGPSLTDSRHFRRQTVASEQQARQEMERAGLVVKAQEQPRSSAGAPPPAQPPLLTPASEHRASWDGPEPSKLDTFIAVMQDKHIDTKRVVQAVKNAAGALRDATDAYLQEELYHGRTSKRVHDFLDRELRPLLTEMAERGVKMAELEEFLHARHAEEANKVIAERNPDMPDGGSGMTTAEAREYLANLDAGKRRTYEALATRVDAITHGTRQLLIDYRLESPETIATWEKTYEHYVPLFREDMDTPGGPGIGQGFSVRGPASKQRTGSQRNVVDILANLAMSRERAIVRGEKNRVSLALYGLAKENPNPDFWKVDSPPTEKVVDPGTGLVVTRVDPLYKSRPNVVVARDLDDSGQIVEHFVVFNPRNERAVRMAEALKNLDAQDLGQVLSIGHKITRYLASINTQYNPVFGVVNMTRDVQGAMLNLTSTPIAGHQREVVQHTLSALRGIYIDIRAARAGKQPQSVWAELWDEFQREGGQTGYRDLFRTSKTRSEAIEREIRRAMQGKAMGATRAIFDWLSDYNLAMENAVRLAAYKVAKEQGMSNQRAASLAKNLTVNFNRRGQIGTQAGALYAFFNASVQGTARMVETLKGPAGRKILIGGVLLGVVQALTLALAGLDDDDIPEFVRARNLIIPIGGKRYLTIPMPLGFHVIPNIGRISTEFVLNGYRDKAERFVDLLDVVVDAFNPVGNAGLSLQTIAPSAIDPIAALAENKDWTGRPISLEDFSSLDPSPGHTRVRGTASEFSQGVSWLLNRLSGGTNYTPGILSPTPNTIDYLIGQATGGVGREYLKAEQTVTSLFTGEELPPYRIPLLGRFYGNAEGQASQAHEFYNNIRDLNMHEAEIEGRRKAREPVSGYVRQYPEARLFEQANSVYREVSELRQKRRDWIERGASRERVRRIDDRITRIMTKFNERVRKAKESNR